MPSAFGYYLYLRFGHLSHHAWHGSTAAAGGTEVVDASLAAAFASDAPNFEDGDVLFASHRMKLRGEAGPRVQVPPRLARAAARIRGKAPPAEAVRATVSVGRAAFRRWKPGHPGRNACLYAASFLAERAMLQVNDLVVAATGRNAFFPNKPEQFHRSCAAYCRCAAAVRTLLYLAGGWRAWTVLTLSEVLWCLPPHPAAAMFVTNHGSGRAEGEEEGCVPTSSTYAGRWYAALTLGTNYHMEHHDFPDVPFHQLGRLRRIAPEFYRGMEGGDEDIYEGDNVFRIMEKAFSEPEFYSCMDDANNLMEAGI
uniref:Fatty acid desaturase domain-containing protein n=1 Tax=Corethron hystrix TaxID=216773 RepID=A0A7S1BEF8_9STRA